MLDQYSHSGKIWVLIHRPNALQPFITKQRVVEYIFEPESLTAFMMVSSNILAHWATNLTRNLLPYEEYQIKESIFIKPYPYMDS